MRDFEEIITSGSMFVGRWQCWQRKIVARV